MRTPYKVLGVIAGVAVIAIVVSVPFCANGDNSCPLDSTRFAHGAFMFLGGVLLLTLTLVAALIVAIVGAVKRSRQVVPPPYVAPAPPPPLQAQPPQTGRLDS